MPVADRRFSLPRRWLGGRDICTAFVLREEPGPILTRLLGNPSRRETFYTSRSRLSRRAAMFGRCSLAHLTAQSWLHSLWRFRARPFTYQGRLTDGSPATGQLRSPNSPRLVSSDQSPRRRHAPGRMTNSTTAISNGLFTVLLRTAPAFSPARPLAGKSAPAPAAAAHFATLNPRRQAHRHTRPRPEPRAVCSNGDVPGKPGTLVHKPDNSQRCESPRCRGC